MSLTARPAGQGKIPLTIPLMGTENFSTFSNMFLALAFYPMYNQHIKNAHKNAAAAWAAKIIGLLSARPDLKLTLFADGELLGELKRNFASEAKQILDFAAKGQIEFLGGGFYDSMFPLFPAQLQEKQLQKHRKMLADMFAIEPSGYFSSSSAWEISLVPTLEKCGFEYAYMPDSSVQNALGRATSVSGWFAAEDQKAFIKILTYSKNLSETCANGTRAEIISAFKKLQESAGERIHCILLPSSLSNDFVQALDTAAAEGVIIEYKLLSQAASEQDSSGKVALMSGECNCRDALSIPEINLLHKKILEIYRRAESVGNLDYQEKIFDELLPVMSERYFKNTATGMKSDIVRFNAYRKAMAAKKLLYKYENLEGTRFSSYDFLLEGCRQALLGNNLAECLIEPQRGGWIRSLSYLPSQAELATSMRDDGDVSPLFLDHIYPVENFDSQAAGESQHADATQRNLWLHNRAAAFLKPYKVQVKKQEDRLQVLLSGEQTASYNGKEYGFFVEKVFSIKNGAAEFLASISITNNSFNAFSGEFATEICLGFRDDSRGQSLRVQGKKVEIKQEPLWIPGANKADFRDRFLGVGLSLESSKSASFLIAPIMGSVSNAAPDTAQGLRIALFRKVDLMGQDSDTIHLRLQLNGGGFFGGLL